MKALLLFEGYRSNLGLKAVKILKQANIIAYCIPKHTNGVTLPFGVDIYDPFKSDKSDGIGEATKLYDDPTFDALDPLKMETETYQRYFTRLNICAVLKRTGIWTLARK